MVSPNSEERVQWVYASTNNQELEDRYDQWAAAYDKDLEDDFAWNAPHNAVQLFKEFVPSSAKVLDAGAGTGLVGEILATLGFKDMVAMDLSMGMLDVAKAKNVYHTFHQMTLGDTLDYKTDEFDAVISVGVFTMGHAPSSSFDELIRVTKPGGYIAFSLRVDMYQDSGFKEKQSALETAGAWKLAKVTDTFQPLPKGEPEVFHQIWAYQVV